MVTAHRTSVEALRRELKLRFQEELENGVQGPSDTLTELVVDPVEVSAFPLFFQKILSRGKDRKNEKKAAVPAGRRVPSRSEGAALPSTLPVTLHFNINDTSSSNTLPSTLPVTLPFIQSSSNDSLPCPSSPPRSLAGGSQSLKKPKQQSLNLSKPFTKKSSAAMTVALKSDLTANGRRSNSKIFAKLSKLQKPPQKTRPQTKDLCNWVI